MSCVATEMVPPKLHSQLVDTPGLTLFHGTLAVARSNHPPNGRTLKLWISPLSNYSKWYRWNTPKSHGRLIVIFSCEVRWLTPFSDSQSASGTKLCLPQWFSLVLCAKSQRCSCGGWMPDRMTGIKLAGAVLCTFFVEVGCQIKCQGLQPASPLVGRAILVLATCQEELFVLEHLCSIYMLEAINPLLFPSSHTWDLWAFIP